MRNVNAYSQMQLGILVILRLAIGWHILYEGIAKLLNPQWTSLIFLQQSQGLLEKFAHWVTSNPEVLNAVDFLNTWGLIAIGLGLLLGLFTRIVAIFGAFLIFIYYLNSPPLIGVEYLLPVEGSNLIIDKTLIEAISLGVLALFPTSKIFGLDSLFEKHKKLK